jgi:hypothetical protein
MIPKPRPVGRPPRGRKPADNRITIRLTDAELKEWTRRAGEMSLGEWIRQRCNH